MATTPEEVLKIVRFGSAKSERSPIGIIPEYPLNIECDKIAFNRMVIRGGWVHQFGMGFVFDPYRLVIERGFENIPKDNNHVFYISNIEETIIVEEYENKEEVPPQSLLDEWNQMMNEYNFR